MRVSEQHRRFVRELFEGVHRPDVQTVRREPGSAARDTADVSVLHGLDRDALFASVAQAARDAEEAAKTARQLTVWAIRLLPYFARCPAYTVEQAREAYARDAGDPGCERAVDAAGEEPR